MTRSLVADDEVGQDGASDIEKNKPADDSHEPEADAPVENHTRQRLTLRGTQGSSPCQEARTHEGLHPRGLPRHRHARLAEG